MPADQQPAPAAPLSAPLSLFTMQQLGGGEGEDCGLLDAGMFGHR